MRRAASRLTNNWLKLLLGRSLQIVCRGWPVRRRSPSTMVAITRMALPPSEEPRSRTVTGRAGAGNGRFATASSTQSWSAWIEASCAVECWS